MKKLWDVAHENQVIIIQGSHGILEQYNSLPWPKLLYLQIFKLTIFLLSISMSRPGVATIIWTPLRITSKASELGTPPIAKHDLLLEILNEIQFNVF